jgi:NAD(P)-dependent dehydrogenase (short-subunit alcohol dehydrogenase family)
MGIAVKVAVVTGAASGIGEATARRLSEEGASVVAVDWSADAVEGVVRTLAGPAAAVHADVSLEEDVEPYMRAALERFGRVDLVACLLSDDASYVTGAVIPIDGGVHASNPLTR